LDGDRKEILIVAGPNGAGKTSFAREFLQAEPRRHVFVNADEIALDLRSAGIAYGNLEIAAGRRMLTLIDQIIEARQDLMFETTLATLLYQRRIADWRSAGYTVCLMYLRLPNVEASMARVARRVAAGGHDIPETTIRQRFAKSRDYFERLYKPIVDEWYVWNSLEGDFEMIEAWDD
jgi:predicted ABC-type ATPase